MLLPLEKLYQKTRQLFCPSSKLTLGPLLFIHIPKTAGTSFRKALEDSLGKNNLFWDYGPNSDETSLNVHEHLYNNDAELEKGCQVIYDSLSEHQLLAGHVRFSKYKSQFLPAQCVTFLREPVGRVISNYRHACRHHGYQKQLRDYVQEPHAQNSLTRYLDGVDLEELGFVGISERYEESIAKFNIKYGTRLRAYQLNKAPKQQTKQTQPTSQEIELIKELNQQDIQLYQKACQLFDKNTA